MKLITSWLNINRSFGAVIGISAAFCALLALGKAPSTNSTTSAAAKQTAPKIMAPSLPKIALVTSDSPTWVAEVQSKLVATGRFSQVDTIDAGSTTPTLAQLLAYKSVLVWTDSGFSDSTTFGNNLADYVDAGGGVVIAVFADVFSYMGGRFASSDYFAVEVGPNTSGTELTLGTVYEPASPLMAGVTSFDGGTSSFHDGSNIVQADAIRVADYSDGEPLIARRTINGNRRVDLNFFPPSSDSRSDFWVSSTDGVTIMANALEYVGLESCVSAPAGMISWWKAEGDAKDSQDGNDGTIGGAGFAPGEVGQAFNFDGVEI
ncbi:MAG: PEP-CTERM sorting domain-containing protein [Verrucomicrobia bacterium]|nr:MAG: PEP-CTERM sorting domain-containing protein [Verrucomicrobiota bacterium]